MASRAFLHPSPPAPLPPHTRPRAGPYPRPTRPPQPALPRIELLHPMRMLDPPGIGVNRPPQPAPPILPTAPPTAPGARPTTSPHRHTRERAPSPPSHPAAPWIELVRPMDELDPPGIGDNRAPSPRRTLLPIALCTRPCVAQWQPGASNHRPCRTPAPVPPCMPLAHAVTVLEPAPFEPIGSTCLACALRSLSAQERAWGARALCSERAPRRSQTSSGPFLYIIKGFGSAVALPSTPTLAEYWPQRRAALCLLGGSCALLHARISASFACHALSHALKASPRQQDAAGRAYDAAAHAPSALQSAPLKATRFLKCRKGREVGA